MTADRGSLGRGRCHLGADGVSSRGQVPDGVRDGLRRPGFRSKPLVVLVRVPLVSVVSQHARELILGTLGTVTTFLVFYLMTVFALNWATNRLGFAREDYLILQMIGVLFFALMIPVSALLADRFGRRATLSAATVGVVAFGIGFRRCCIREHSPASSLFSCWGSPWRA